MNGNSISNLRTLLQTIRSWALVAASTSILIMFVIYGSFQLAFIFHPILDVAGGNLDQMEVDQRVYSPGDMIIVRFKMQKQRPARGIIKWTIVDHGWSHPFPERAVSGPAPEIVDRWVEQEKIPENTPTGRKYHLEGTLTYPLPSFWFMRRTVSYPLKTECFEVR